MSGKIPGSKPDFSKPDFSKQDVSKQLKFHLRSRQKGVAVDIRSSLSHWGTDDGYVGLCLTQFPFDVFICFLACFF